MKVNRLLKGIIYSMALLIIVGCSTKESEEEAKIDLFSVKEAEEVAKNYLEYIKVNDVESANNLCYPELVENTEIVSVGASEIESFGKDMIIEGNESANFIFNVVRKSNNEASCNLETVAIDVKREEEEYKIDVIKSSTKNHIYVNNDELRIIGEGSGNSQLIVKLNNLSRDTYLSSNEIMMYKKEVPKNIFGTIGMSFSGENVAISTENSESSYICIANIDSSMMANASAQPEEETENTAVEDKDNLEKAIAQRIISLDVLENAKVIRFNFSESEKLLEVDYIVNSEVDRIRLYNAIEGRLIKIDFDNNFPENKYSLVDGKFEGDEFLFKVESIDDSIDDVIGKYSVDIESLEINKL